MDNKKAEKHSFNMDSELKELWGEQLDSELKQALSSLGSCKAPLDIKNRLKDPERLIKPTRRLFRSEWFIRAPVLVPALALLLLVVIYDFRGSHKVVAKNNLTAQQTNKADENLDQLLAVNLETDIFDEDLQLLEDLL
ncbi:MAG: hypothetical protein D6719_07890 [Candidatus Dadabacteria bacterium]|nr:MAG: hypothetical protein D6719_07890 [Candidatus Dadabacteria bacterium]